MARPPHLITFRENMAEIRLLLEIHARQAGRGRGRKWNVQVLNRAAIVFVVACWEAFIEDLAKQAAAAMTNDPKTPQVFPPKVLGKIGGEIKATLTDLRVWDLTGDGWKGVLKQHAGDMLKKHVGTFNTPKHANIDNLFVDLIGMKGLSTSWKWAGSTPARATKRLDDLVTRRGEIAHRVKSGEPVRKKDVVAAIRFVEWLSMTSSNSVSDYVSARTGTRPWPRYRMAPRAKRAK